MELNKTELGVLAKFHEIIDPAFDYRGEYEVSERVGNPAGFMTHLRTRTDRVLGKRKVFEDLPHAITARNIMVGFLVYHDGKTATAIEGYIADDNENWENKGNGIDWLSGT